MTRPNKRARLMPLIASAAGDNGEPISDEQQQGHDDDDDDDQQKSLLCPFLELPQDCMNKVFLWLQHDDAIRFALCNKRSNKLAQPILHEQTTRTAVLNFRQSSGPNVGDAILRLFDCMVSKAKVHPFFAQKGPCHFQIVPFSGLDTTQHWGWQNIKKKAAEMGVPRLTAVTSLDLSHCYWSNKLSLGSNICLALAYVFPNLEHVNLSHTSSTRLAFDAFNKQAMRIERLTFHGPITRSVQLSLRGRNFPKASNLVELDVQDICFIDNKSVKDNDDNVFLLECQRLQRVNIRGVKVRLRHRRHGDDLPLPHGMIVNFVRRTPSLKWLCSDLPAEVVADLEASHPQVTFVSSSSTLT